MGDGEGRVEAAERPVSKATERDLLAKASPRPWRWLDAAETDHWCDPDQIIRYRLLQSASVRAVAEHAQTWAIREDEAELIVRAVNEYEALLDVADAASAVDDEHAYGVAAAMGTAEKLRQALSVLDSVRRGAS